MTDLETERLLFRSHWPQEEDAFVAMPMDAKVRRYVGGRAGPREEVARRRVLRREVAPRGLHC
jgi:hypothetical protein